MLDIQTSNSVVADHLKKIIISKGIKNSSVAEKAGFTAQEFSDMLNGRRLIRAVDIASIVNVLQDFGVDANDLFGITKTGKER